MSRIERFLIKFFISATIFFIIWIFVGIYYQNLVLFVSKPFLILMGYERYLPALRLGNAYLGNFNLVPFLALVVSIDADLRNRIKLLLFGFLIMLFIHSLDLIAHFPAYFQHSELAILIVYSLPILNVGFPFLLWIIWFFSSQPR